MLMFTVHNVYFGILRIVLFCCTHRNTHDFTLGILFFLSLAVQSGIKAVFPLDACVRSMIFTSGKYPKSKKNYTVCSVYTAAHAQHTTQKEKKKKKKNDQKLAERQFNRVRHIIVEVTQYKRNYAKCIRNASFSYWHCFYPAHPLASFNSSQVIFSYFYCILFGPKIQTHNILHRIWVQLGESTPKKCYEIWPLHGKHFDPIGHHQFRFYNIKFHLR